MESVHRLLDAIDGTTDPAVRISLWARVFRRCVELEWEVWDCPSLRETLLKKVEEGTFVKDPEFRRASTDVFLTFTRDQLGHP